MKVCLNNGNKVKTHYKHPEAIAGHLYKRVRETDFLYLCGRSMTLYLLYSIEDGGTWSYNSTFGASDVQWEDVTNKFTLVED